MSRTSLILRDIMYAVLIVTLLLPSNALGLSLLVKILVIVAAIGVRLWQHVNYYKETGKIY